MYPPQTSLIPVTVALARFIEIHGFFTSYPYWYLGVPTRFLTGPIIPGILIWLHKMLSSLTYFDLSYIVILISFVMGALGWGILAKILSSSTKIGILTGVLFLILPWKYLSAFTLSETSIVVAKNFLPWVLITLNYFFTQKNLRWLILAIFIFVMVLLINTSIIPTLVIGILALTCVVAFGNQGHDQSFWENFFDYGKRSLVILLVSLLLVTFWYTPPFWIATLINPSLGGNTGLKVILHLLDLGKTILPLSLAVLVVFFARKMQNPFAIFNLVWVGIFAMFSLFRFLVDIDFWQDWSSWFYELEIGLALVLASKNKFWGDWGYWGLLIVPFILSFYIYPKLGSPALVSQNLPQAIASLDEVNKLAGGQDKLVFLSGSSVFWANALYDIYQVRGGRDEVSVNSWQDAAYVIRESPDPEKTKTRISELGATYVLVHTGDSKEFYRDFKNLEKWESMGHAIWEKNGDVIYQF